MSRKTTPCKCAVCGKEFTAKRGDAMYCSKRCCSAAYYARHREKDPTKMAGQAVAVLDATEQLRLMAMLRKVRGE